jgi:hypothetical protein
LEVRLRETLCTAARLDYQDRMIQSVTTGLGWRTAPRVDAVRLIAYTLREAYQIHRALRLSAFNPSRISTTRINLEIIMNRLHVFGITRYGLDLI